MSGTTRVIPTGTRPYGSGSGMTAATPAGVSQVSGVEWVDEDAAPDKHCEAFKVSGDRCSAYKKKDSEWCAGHARKFGDAVGE